MTDGAPCLTAAFMGVLSLALIDGCSRRVGFEVVCVPEQAAELCAQLAAECGSIATSDRCGLERTVSCGDCVLPDTCAGGGTEHVCGHRDSSSLTFVDSTESDFGAGSQDGVHWNSTDQTLENDGSQIWGIQSAWVDTSGLVGLWHLNESAANETSNGTIVDSSGLGHDGALQTGDGAISKSSSGQLGGAVTFDGADDHIQIPHNAALAPTSALTVHAWFKTSNLAQAGLIVSKRENGGWKMGFRHFDCPADAFCISLRVGAVFYTAAHPASRFAPDRWHHVVGTYDNETLRLYVNGAEVSNEPTPSGDIVYTYDNPLCIGEEDLYTSCEEGGNFQGVIDEVALWNRALSAEEIAAISARQAPIRAGRFRSRVFDAGSAVSWTTLSWLPNAPYAKELPPNGESETAYFEGNADMSGNILLLHLDEGAGATVFQDDSPGAHDGACDAGSNACPEIRAAGKLMQGVEFDGVNDLIRINHQSAFNAFPFSMSAWIKTHSAGDGGILTQHIEPADPGFQLYMKAGDLCASYTGPSPTQAVDDGTGCPLRASGYNDGRWHHVVFVVDAASGRLFVDGAERTTQPWTGTAAATVTTADLLVGHSPPTTNTYFRGMIDEVTIWDRALADREIKSLHRRGAVGLRFWVRTCDAADCSDATFVGSDGSASTQFSELSSSSVELPRFDLPESLMGRRYFQYEAELESNDGPAVVTYPKVRRVSVEAIR